MKLTNDRQAAQIKQTEAAGEPVAGVSTPASLEQAVAAGDVDGVKKLLREGADPARVSTELLSGVGLTTGASACAQLIRVAARLQRMGIAKPHAAQNKLVGASHVPGNTAAVKARFAGRFALGFKKKLPPVLETPITKALLAHDLPAAKAALTSSPTPEIIFLKRNIDHLNGVLALDDQAKLKELHRSGMLESALSSVQAPGTREMLKEYSYASHKPGRSSRVALNGAVTFRGSEELIECRHLAMHWLVDRPVGKDGKRDYKRLSSPKTMQAALKKQTDATFTSFRHHCKEAHLVDIDMFGGLLASQFTELAKAGPGAPPRRMLILSDSHAMACELKFKQDQSGHPVYAVSFYDPNLTATHRRVRLGDLKSVEALSMHDLINDPRLVAEYYGGQSLAMVMVVPDEGAAIGSSSSTPRLASEATGKRQLTSGPERLEHAVGAGTEGANVAPLPDISANHLFQLLDNNFIGDLPQAFKQIDAMPDVEQQVAVLAAVNSQGVPALAKLFVGGDDNTQAVSMFATAVLSSEVLSSSQKTELLMARLPEPVATRGFLVALVYGQTEVVTAFMHLVLNSPALSPEEKCSLLEARATGDLDFLNGTIDRGHGNTVIAYQEALARSTLSPQMIRDMQTHA